MCKTVYLSNEHFLLICNKILLLLDYFPGLVTGITNDVLELCQILNKQCQFYGSLDGNLSLKSSQLSFLHILHSESPYSICYTV